MPYWALQLLDIFFVVFHSALILFILFGWLVPRLRLAHLICVLLTGGSWFLLGLIYGIGYCPLTDWHWAVLYKMGKTGLPGAYIPYILERLLGISLTARTADAITLLGWLAALIVSVSLQIRLFINKRKK